jgi:thiamine biosynthesis lipoprotein
VIRTEAAMGTVVSIEVDAPEAAVSRAFGWFREVEARCSRFDEGSELRQLAVGAHTVASEILFESVRFALLLAEQTGGAFDPAVGGRMAARGYSRHYATGEICDAPDSSGVSYRDVELDVQRRSILLRRPLTLDLGAVAKGLAVDVAARELQPFRDFLIDAGGDMYFGGRHPQGRPWCAGISHPVRPGELVGRLRVADSAVCTSGNYARGRHILDARSGEAAERVASATVVAPSAMLADALATATCVLGVEEGLALLTRLGVEGLIVTPDLQCHSTAGLMHA